MGYSIFIASVERAATQKDPRLTLRVIPHMQDLPVASLPKWPCFFKNEIITGSVGEYVWVIAADDFSIGYVLGYLNGFNWDTMPDSIPSSLYDSISDAYISLKGMIYDFSNILVTYWDADSIHFVDRKKGSHVIAFRNGTIHTVSPSEILSAVGSSIFKITSQEIILSAGTIRVEGDVKLGRNPQGNVMVSSGTSGRNSLPSSSVWG
jgi:hypothetical protein